MDNKFILYEQFLREPQAYTPKFVTIIAIIGLLLLLMGFIFRNFIIIMISCICIFTSIVVSMIFYLPIIGYEAQSIFGVEDKIPDYKGRYLKDFENNIKVEDNKVIIDNLEDKYYYPDIVVDTKNYVNKKPFGGNFAINDVNMKDVKGLNIHVDSNKVVIDKLPERYSYEKLDNGNKLKANVKQQFKYEVNEFNSSYLVSEDGGKIKLNEEDTKFLKERGVLEVY